MPDVYEIDLSPKKHRLNARLLPDLIEMFLRDAGFRVQEKTVYGYRAKLRHVVDWWMGHGPLCDWLLDDEQLTYLNEYLESVISERDEPLSYNSRNDVLRRLRQVLNWAYRKKHVPINLGKDVPSPRGMPPIRLPVELEVLNRLLDAASLSSNPNRDQALVAMLAGTGGRCEECVSLRVCDVTLYADQSGYAVLQTTKFDIPRVVGLDSATGLYIQHWLDILGDPMSPLFPSRKGKGKEALTPSGAYKVMVRLAEDAGVRDQIQGAHDLRRLFATLWLRRLPGEGYGQLLQMQLGHSDFATTQKYSLQDVQQVLQVMRQRACSPLAQLSESRLSLQEWPVAG